MKKTTLAALLLCSAGFWSASASARVTCNVSVGNVAFGIYDVFSGSGLASTSSFTITCERTLLIPSERNLNFNMELSGNASTFREMSSGGHRLKYNLYANSNHTTPWGNGAYARAGALTFSLANLGPESVIYTVYGLVPGNQMVAAGVYGDTINVTVNF